MTAPVVWMAVTGNAIAVDLTQPAHGPMAVHEARRRIAREIGKPLAFVRMLDPATNSVLQDGATVSAEIQVFVSVDPAVEQAAEARLLRETGAHSMANLAARARIELNVCQLATLPESFGQLVTLQHLSLHNNQLTALPESFGQLAALEELNLGSNQLTALAESFGQLAALQTLNLDSNQLAALPESFGQLTANIKM